MISRIAVFVELYLREVVVMFHFQKTFVCLCFIFLSGCGGGGSSTDDGESNSLQENTRISALISVENETYEIDDEPAPIFVTSEFEENLSFISIEGLDISNARVQSFSPLGNGRYAFHIIPDIPAQDIEVFIRVDAYIGQSGLRNEGSNRLVIRAVDTVSPMPTLAYEVVSYGEDQSVNEVELTITLSEDIENLSQDVLGIENLEILTFTKNTNRDYTVSVRSLGQPEDISLSIGLGAFSDEAGNGNLASNTVVLSSQPIEPDKVSDVTIVTGLKQLTFEWQATSNATYFQVLERKRNDVEYLAIGPEIPANSSLSYAIENISLYKYVGAQVIVQACNGSGCVNSDPVDVTNSLWDAVGYLKAPKSFDGQTFGSKLAISKDGGVMAVAAVNDGLADENWSSEQDNGLYRSGAVYLYRKVNGDWQFETLLQASNRERRDAFGESVSLNQDGSVLAVGAYNEDGLIDNPDSNASEDSGAVYIYRYKNNLWSFENYLKASNGNADDLFGAEVALDAEGNTLAVSARGKEGSAGNSAPGAGAVYVFEWADSDWTQTAFIRASNQGDYHLFGSSIAINSTGTTLVVGAPLEDQSGYNEFGSASVYQFQNNNWVKIDSLAPNVNLSRVRFGYDVAISDSADTIVVASNTENEIPSDSNDSGAVYIFERNGVVYELSTKLRVPNPVDYTSFGEGIAFNGAGDTLVVASSEYSQLDYGFYDSPSPNNNRPFSAKSNYIYKRQNNNTWERIGFIKTGYGGDSTFAIDTTGENIVYGTYTDGRMVDGYAAMGNIDFDSVEKESYVGAVLVY